MTPLCWPSSTHQEMLKICLSSGHHSSSIFSPSFSFYMNKNLKLILSGLASLNIDYFIWQTLDFGCTFSSSTCVFKRRSPLEREKKWVIELQKSILVSLNSFENSLLYVYWCLELAPCIWQAQMEVGNRARILYSLFLSAASWSVSLGFTEVIRLLN